MCISTHAPSSKPQMTVKFTGQSTILGHPYGSFFTSPFWRQEFGSFSQIFERFVDFFSVVYGT
jgi:hypothetical protein